MMHLLIKPLSEFDAVVLAGGTYPKHGLPANILSRAKHIVCCDSAFQSLPYNLIDRVEAIIGDGDSLSPELQEKYHDLLHIDYGQDDNDLTKATRYCISQGYQCLAYVGATGKREDHTLGNISLLIDYLRKYQLDITMITDYGTFIPCYKNTEFESFPHQQVSIFNDSCSFLENEGLKWASFPYHSLWQGTLNEALAYRISFRADGYYLVYLTHEAK